MIAGVGVDIVEIARMERAVTRTESFAARVFTPKEIAYCGTGKLCFQRFAARFAVKEAVSKALGITWSDAIPWTDAEVDMEPSGKPFVRMTGRAADRMAKLGVTSIHISITHSGGYAVAMAVAEG